MAFNTRLKHPNLLPQQPSPTTGKANPSIYLSWAKAFPEGKVPLSNNNKCSWWLDRDKRCKGTNDTIISSSRFQKSPSWPRQRFIKQETFQRLPSGFFFLLLVTVSVCDQLGFSSVSTQTCCQALCSASQQDGVLSSEEGTKEWVIRNSQSAFFACRKGITRVKQIPLWGLIRGNYHFVGQKHQQLCMVSSIQNLHFLIALFLFSSWAEVVSELFTMACKPAGSAHAHLTRRHPTTSIPACFHHRIFAPALCLPETLPQASAWSVPSHFRRLIFLLENLFKKAFHDHLTHHSLSQQTPKRLSCKPHV